MNVERSNDFQGASYSCVVTATVYHPSSSNDDDMAEYLCRCLTKVGGSYPGCGLVITGDFNHLDVKLLCQEFQLKQLVHLLTRDLNTLDLVLTNLHDVYKPKSAELSPSFCLSDHYTIAIYPKQLIPKSSCSRRKAFKRDTRSSRKMELGRFLKQIDWHIMDSAMTCEDKNTVFTSIISTGLDLLMPEKHFKFHRNGAPWINEDFKQLINQRQQAFSSCNTI